MANRTYMSSFGSSNAETAHVDDSSANTTTTPLYVLWDRKTLTANGVFKSVADAQAGAAAILRGPNYQSRLAIVTVPA